MSLTYRGARVSLDVLRVTADAVIDAPATDEAAVVLLAGDVEWETERATRRDVFDGCASAVFVPPGASVHVCARAPSELAIARTVDCDLTVTDAPAVTIQPDDVVVHERGEPGWRRAVHDVIADNVDAQCLIVGETFNAPGEWSSFPPHKHDGADGEPALEEVYYFRFDKPDGFGFQGLYEEHGDERAVFLRHNTIVGIPRGYHPVCAAPGYRLYYLWALVGTPRRLAMYEDPAHRWLHTSGRQ